jgi:ribonuclease-3
MEFLGDRVLGLLTAQHIMREWPAANESELNRHLQVLVDKPACARVAKRMDVGPALRMDGGETQAGLRKNDSVLADVMEALLAAIYLDGGIEAAKAVYHRAWAEELTKAPPSHAAANVKAALQEWAQKAGRPLPTYRIVSQTGSDHAPTFQVEVSIQGVEPLTATGRSRQEAEKAAASAMLKREGLI